MNLLLDTHVLIWALAEPERLSIKARDAILDPANEIVVSAASIWEITIKHTRAAVALPFSGEDAVRFSGEAGFRFLDVKAAHAVAVGRLPLHHKDPFDRLLIAQATVESMRLLTRDQIVLAYGGPVMRA